MNRRASAGICSPRSAKCNWISPANRLSSGCPIRATGVIARRVFKSGSCGAQAGGSFIGDHDQRPAAILRLIPGMEQLFLVAAFGIVEQTSPNPLDKAARKQASA